MNHLLRWSCVTAFFFALGIPGCSDSQTKDPKDIVKDIQPVETAKGHKDPVAVGREDTEPLPKMQRRR